MEKRKSFVFPDSIELAFLEGLTLLCLGINQSKTSIGTVIDDFRGLKKLSFHCIADIIYF